MVSAAIGSSLSWCLTSQSFCLLFLPLFISSLSRFLFLSLVNVPFQAALILNDELKLLAHSSLPLTSVIPWVLFSMLPCLIYFLLLTPSQAWQAGSWVNPSGAPAHIQGEQELKCPVCSRCLQALLFRPFLWPSSPWYTPCLQQKSAHIIIALLGIHTWLSIPSVLCSLQPTRGPTSSMLMISHCLCECVSTFHCTFQDKYHLARKNPESY